MRLLGCNSARSRVKELRHEEKDLVTSYDLGVNGYIRRLVGSEFRKMVHTLRFFWLLLNQLPSPQTPNASAGKPG